MSVARHDAWAGRVQPGTQRAGRGRRDRVGRNRRQSRGAECLALGVPDAHDQRSHDRVTEERRHERSGALDRIARDPGAVRPGSGHGHLSRDRSHPDDLAEEVTDVLGPLEPIEIPVEHVAVPGGVRKLDVAALQLQPSLHGSALPGARDLVTPLILAGGPSCFPCSSPDGQLSGLPG
jgi:hypothetical protein